MGLGVMEVQFVFKIKLNGNKSTTRGLGARVKVVDEHLNMIREVDGGIKSCFPE